MKRLLLVILTSQLTLPSAYASIKELGLKDAVNQALNRNAAIKVSEEKLTEASANKTLSVERLLPSLSLATGAAYKKDPLNIGNPLFNGEPYNQYDFGLMAVQPIFDGGGTWAAIRAASQETRVKELDLQIAKRNITLEVIKSYYSLLLADKKIRTIEKNRQMQLEQLSTAQSRYAIGRAQLLDVLQVKTGLALLESKTSAAKEQLDLAAAEIATLLGESEASAISLTGDLKEPDWNVISRRIEDNLKSGPSRLPELEKTDTQLEQLDNLKTVSLSKHYPQLGASALWKRSSYAKIDLLDNYSTSWALAIQLTIPIFSGFSSYSERNALGSQRKQLEITQWQQTDQASLDQIRAKKELDLARVTASTSASAYTLAAEAAKEATKEYKLRTIDDLKYLQLQQTYLDSELLFEQAKFDYITASARYFVASGFSLLDLVNDLDTPTRTTASAGKGN
jgi:outer membrane protein